MIRSPGCVMNKISKAVAGASILLAGMLASTGAFAQHHGPRHSGGVRLGVYIGAPHVAVRLSPYYWPSPYYAYPYPPAYVYPPVVIAPAAPPVYVEQYPAPPAPAPQAAASEWYYCASARAYYPYVGECAQPWQRVPAQPVPQ